MKVYNREEMPAEMVAAFGKGAATHYLGRLAGSQKLCVNIDVLPPGGHSAKFHAHSRQEEFFLILAGSGVLRTNEGEQPVARGDFIAKPAGLENPHQFYNSDNVPLEILDVSTVEQGDVAYYPDDDVYLLRGTGVALPGGARIVDFSTDPDDTPAGKIT